NRVDSDLLHKPGDFLIVLEVAKAVALNAKIHRSTGCHESLLSIDCPLPGGHTRGASADWNGRPPHMQALPAGNSTIQTAQVHHAEARAQQTSQVWHRLSPCADGAMPWRARRRSSAPRAG